jgi:hypothetical protein
MNLSPEVQRICCSIKYVRYIEHITTLSYWRDGPKIQHELGNAKFVHRLFGKLEGNWRMLLKYITVKKGW